MYRKLKKKTDWKNIGISYIYIIMAAICFEVLCPDNFCRPIPVQQKCITVLIIKKNYKYIYYTGPDLSIRPPPMY